MSKKRLWGSGEQHAPIFISSQSDADHVEGIRVYLDGFLTEAKRKNFEVTVQVRRELEKLVILERLVAYDKVRNAILHSHASNDLTSDTGAIPESSLKLLPFLLPKKLRDNVFGDLAEDFRTYATQWGRPYALRWLWWELAGLAVRRFGPAGIITAVAMWFRQKLGW